MRSDHYNFIVAGAGAAGLSLIIHLIDSGKFKDKTILLVDRAPKVENDRTWCFWEDSAGLFESIVYRRWSKLWFHSKAGRSALHDIAPYQYKMIRGVDFYNYCFDIIRAHGNITVEYGQADYFTSDDERASLTINGRVVTADYIFSSILPYDVTAGKHQYFLWQHFKGWFVQTTHNAFTPGEATLMDFRVEQDGDTRFVYVMPFSANEALIEYTGLSKARLSDEQYGQALRTYCTDVFRIGDFKILSSEFGMIPMTNFNFPESDGRVIYIGTAGGQTKASSGYTFKNIQKHSKFIAEALVDGREPLGFAASRKFNFYDSIFLRILSEKDTPGAEIFAKLFETNKMTSVFKFLDNETALQEDLRLISKLPTVKFMKAAVSHLLK